MHAPIVRKYVSSSFTVTSGTTSQTTIAIPGHHGHYQQYLIGAGISVQNISLDIAFYKIGIGYSTATTDLTPPWGQLLAQGSFRSPAQFTTGGIFQENGADWYGRVPIFDGAILRVSLQTGGNTSPGPTVVWAFVEEVEDGDPR